MSQWHHAVAARQVGEERGRNFDIDASRGRWQAVAQRALQRQERRVHTLQPIGGVRGKLCWNRINTQAQENTLADGARACRDTSKSSTPTTTSRA